MKSPPVLNSVLERTATRFLRRIYRVTHRMPVALRPIEKKRVLVVSPHPDDEALAIGGCLALHRRAGSAITVVFVAIDEPTASGKVPRKGETDRSSKVLGFDYRFLEVPDGVVSRREDFVAKRLEELIRANKPDVVYAPFPGDHHRDHQAVAACTSVAVRKSGFKGEIWCYEMWSNLWPNCGVDISSVVTDKRSAIECYASQLDMPYAEAVLGLNRYRGLKLQVPYAEGLFVCNAATFQDLCSSLATI